MVSKMRERMSKAMSLIYLVILIISSYVLVFSSIPLLYRIIIVAFSVLLLLLLSMAVQSLEGIEQPAFA